MGDLRQGAELSAEENSAPRRAGRRRLTVDERREELIAAALRLFSHKPAHEVSIDDVAEAAGASRALVYHYFGGKHELYVAALRGAAKQLGELLEPPVEGRPVERLGLALSRYFDFVEDHAAGFSALLRGGPGSRVGELGEIVEEVRQLLIDRILHELGVREPGPVLRLTLRSWIASVETAGLDWLDRRDLPREQLERLLIDQHVMLMYVAAKHDPEVASIVNELARHDIGWPD